ncbi:secondary thiamine-phosphate synthase enzyme YjbQ [Candidatus Alkanophaga liquidiphilum]|nr:thiamine phosphate synthase YjbQ [Candidatus Alkanophaga liquidiphilum]RLG38178.1 MAG: YjbQ family protein [Candidatus Alkanophagales archaeon]
MKVFVEEIGVRSETPVDILDVTEKILSVVRRSGVRNGVVVVFTKHTTAAVAINENERRLKQDVLSVLQKLVPKGAGYKHDEIDDNAHAHIQAMLLGVSEAIPINDGELQLGTWQRVFFVELDGPRSRRLTIQIIGE